MGNSYRESGRGMPAKPHRPHGDSFKCGNCGQFVGPTVSGGHNRNHCPLCLFSRHVDADVSGDRLNVCGGSMEPVGAFTRPKGEHCIVHRCLRCGYERFNRIAADDDFERVLALPVVEPRVAPPRRQRIRGW